LDFAVLEPLLTRYDDQLSALVAPVQPDAKDGIPASLVGRILNLLKSNFDYVVVDTSPSFDEYVLAAFDETDELLLVTTLDVPTLKNVKVAVETLDLLNFPKSHRHLVLNRADDKVGLTPDKVESTLGMSIAGAIPTSSQVAHATNSGEPIVSAHPRHAVSQAVGKLARRIESSAGTSGELAPEQGRAAGPKRSLLRRNGR
jgi:pilus assembly protein CpaE